MRKAIPLLVLFLIVGIFLVQTGCSKKNDPVTSDDSPACAITMTNPGEIGGQEWDTDETINIRWTHTTGGEVKIDLFKGANWAGSISDRTANDGHYSWVHCSTFGQDSGEDYSIEVTHLTSTDCQDRTNNFGMNDFSNCFVTFPWTEHNPIPDLVAGIEFAITWDSDDTSGFVNLELWDEPLFGQGVFIGYIAEHLDDSGSYLWVVDSLNRGTDEGYRLKIRDDRAGDHDCHDRTTPFQITDDVICTIEVLGIGDGQSFSLGTILPISFGFVNSSKVVGLRLYAGNLQVPGGLITSNFDTQNGTVDFEWTVDYYQHNLPVFDRFNIRAFDVDDEYCVGQSSDFEITQ